MANIVAEKGLLATFTYWPPSGQDGFGGPTFATPVVLKGKMEQRQEQFQNLQGVDQVSKAIVYVNSRDVEIGGYLAAGNHTGQANPHAIADAWLIQGVRDVPDMRNLYHSVRVFL